jgi:quinohemoprotein ethanol dehydrogenase
MQDGIVKTLGKLTAPFVVQGRVYVASDAGAVFALDATSGKLLWTYTANIPGMRCPGQKDSPFCPAWCDQPVTSDNIVVDQGNVYSAMKNQLFALNAQSGHLLWSATVPSYQQVTGNLLYAHGNLYTITYSVGASSIHPYQQTFISAYQAASGAKIWQTYDAHPNLSNVLVQGNLIYALSQSNLNQTKLQPSGVYSWDIRSGKPGWSYTASMLIIASPLLAVGNTLIFYSAGIDAQKRYLQTTTIALNAQSGQLRWKGQPSMEEPEGVHGSSLYSLQLHISGDSTKDETLLVAYDATNDKKQWQQILPSPLQPYDNSGVLDVLVQP